MVDSILYAEENNIIFVRALGRMTANICYDFRERIFARLAAAPAVKNVFIDLSGCDYMDSTFMGIILGVNKKMKKTALAGVTVVCPTEECNILFSSLNILNLFSVDKNQMPFPSEMELISSFEKPNPEFMLYAHDDLAEVSEENADKFKLLRDILQKRVMDERRKDTAENIRGDDRLDDADEGDRIIEDSSDLKFEDD